MTDSELAECMETLAELFPQSNLSEAELKLVRDQLRKFWRDDALDSIRTHRLKCRFTRPDFDTILALGWERHKKRPASPRKQSGYVTAIAQGVASANPQLQGRPEAELILRYHRFWWFFYKADNLQRAAQKSPANQEVESARRDRQLAGIQQKCVADLVQAGMTIEMATSAAEWIDAAPMMFDEWAADSQAALVPMAV